MKRAVALLVVLATVAVSARAESSATSNQSTSGLVEFFSGIKTAIERNLGRPYVWGATGQKSFDCSGFIWRVMYENGILMKRTTARKFYMMLKPAAKEEQGNFGTVVFFDDLKHVGIIDSPQAFYHAQSVVGTNRSQMSPYWKKMVYGYRLLPLPDNK
jgi:cell wall-associated NlpC family hydrolase